MTTAPVILGYHAVSDRWPSELAVTPNQLRSHLTYFKRLGFASFTFVESERLRRASALPRRSLVITFDDAYESTLLALPVLRELGFKATVFAVTSYVGSTNPMKWTGIEEWIDSRHANELRSLDWDQLEELRSEGWEVGSHTVTHPDLTAAGPEAVAEELGTSRTVISDRLGTCETLAYPYGRATATTGELAQKEGYEAACTLPRFQHTDTSMFRPRIGIYRSDSGFRFKMKASPLTWRLRQSNLTRLVARDGKGPDQPIESHVRDQ